MDGKKPKPNAPCHCGSGKKYKKCCLHNDGQKEDVVSIKELLSYATIQDAHEWMEIEKRLKNNTDETKSQDVPGVNPQAEAWKNRLLLRRNMMKDYIPLMCHVLNITRDQWNSHYDKDQDDYLLELFQATITHAVPSVAAALDMPLGTVHTLIKSGNFSFGCENLLQHATVMYAWQHEEHFALELGYVEVYMEAMERHLDESCSANAAIDLASGAGVFPFEYTYRAIHSDNARILQWWPSEWRIPNGQRNPLGRLRIALLYKANDCESSHDLAMLSKMCWTHGYRSSRAQGRWKQMEEILENPRTGNEVADPTGFLGWGAHMLPLYPKHKVKLVGLSSEKFNNRLGIINGKDPKSPDRIGVQVDGYKKPMSFKTANLVNLDAKSTARILLFRSFELDILDRATWGNFDASYHADGVRTLKGQCAVVTCTSLLTKVGKYFPLIWQQAMEVASMMLAPGGIFLQHDTIEFSDFGRKETMREYAQKRHLHLELVECSEPIKNPDGATWGKMLLIVWKKTTE